MKVHVKSYDIVIRQRFSKYKGYGRIQKGKDGYI